MTLYSVWLKQIVFIWLKLLVVLYTIDTCAQVYRYATLILILHTDRSINKFWKFNSFIINYLCTIWILSDSRARKMNYSSATHALQYPSPQSEVPMAMRNVSNSWCVSGGASSFPFSAVKQSHQQKRNHARLKAASNPQPGLQNGRERLPVSACGVSLCRSWREENDVKARDSKKGNH